MDFTCAPHAVGYITSNIHTHMPAGTFACKMPVKRQRRKENDSDELRMMGRSGDGEVAAHVMGKELHVLFSFYARRQVKRMVFAMN